MSQDLRILEDIRLLSKSVDEMEVAIKDNADGSLNDRCFSYSSAMLLSQFYTGLEQCIERQLKVAEVPLPEGSPQYHSELLRLAIDAKILPSQCIETIQDLRGFRNYARKAYGGD